MTGAPDDIPPTLAKRIQDLTWNALAKDPQRAVGAYMDGQDIATQGRLLCSHKMAWFLARKIGFTAFAGLVKRQPVETQRKIVAVYITNKGVHPEKDAEGNVDTAYERQQQETLNNIKSGWPQRRAKKAPSPR